MYCLPSLSKKIELVDQKKRKYHFFLIFNFILVVKLFKTPPFGKLIYNSCTPSLGLGTNEKKIWGIKLRTFDDLINLLA